MRWGQVQCKLQFCYFVYLLWVDIVLTAYMHYHLVCTKAVWGKHTYYTLLSTYAHSSPKPCNTRAVGVPQSYIVVKELSSLKNFLLLYRRSGLDILGFGGYMPIKKIFEAESVPFTEILFYNYFLNHFWRRQWHPTPVLLPGKSHGRRSLVGCSPWGR